MATPALFGGDNCAAAVPPSPSTISVETDRILYFTVVVSSHPLRSASESRRCELPSGSSPGSPEVTCEVYDVAAIRAPQPDHSKGPDMAAMHEIDYKIFGDDMQFVEVELDPNEATVAEAGGMMYMDDGIEMETIFGDGSQQQGGILGALMGAGKRLLTGESLFMTVFLNRSGQKKKVAFGAPYPGKIVAIHLAEIGGELIAQKDSFLAAAKGVSIGIAFQRKLGVGLFGGEGFIMQRLQGDGWAFVHAGGTLHERTLAPGELIRVDTGCIVAFQPSVNYDIQYVGKIKSALFGGEGLVLRDAARARARSGCSRCRSAGWPTGLSPPCRACGGGRREEGSILGGLGGLLDGDNS